MLLCALCHKHIDDRPLDFPKAKLLGFKARHEARVRHLTGLSAERSTTFVHLKARVAGRPMDISLDEVTEAVAPRWPSDAQGIVIDLTAIPDQGDGFVGAACDAIKTATERLYAPGSDVGKTKHISLFALAPIPILVFLGHRLSDKTQIDFFQRHRDAQSPQTWAWRTVGDPVAFDWNVIRQGSDSTRVAVLLSLSGSIQCHTLPATINEAFTIYECVPRSRTASVDLLRQRADLENFRTSYRAFLAQLMKQHAALREVHLFPAVPAPIAVVCGHDLLPKIHPALLVYDNDKAKGGFTSNVRVNDNDGK